MVFLILDVKNHVFVILHKRDLCRVQKNIAGSFVFIVNVGCKCFNVNIVMAVYRRLIHMTESIRQKFG